VAAQINSFNSNPEFVASSTGGTVEIYTAPAVTNPDLYNAADLGVTTHGNVCCSDCIFSVSSQVPGAAAPVVPVLSSLQVNGVDLMSGYTPGTITSIADALADLTAYINTQSATTGYVAYSSQNSMRLSVVITESDDPPFNVNVIPISGYGVVSGTSAPLIVTVKPPILSGPFGSLNNNNPITGGTNPIAFVSGGVPGLTGYTHNWQLLNPGNNVNNVNITVLNGTTNAPIFVLNQDPVFEGVGSTSAQFVDIVTDSSGNISTSNPLTVLFF